MQNLKNQLRTILAFALLISATSCSQIGSPPTLPSAQATTLPSSTPVATTLQSGNATRTLMVNGLKREYLLHTPSGLAHSRTVPVVFAFHGFGSTPEEMQGLTGFDQIADTDGFLVVYPRGTDLSWNVGPCCGTASTNNVDETAFIRQILSDLETVASVDTKRIYAVGFSNGAALVYRLACDMSDTFAASASVAGVLLGTCQPQQPVALLHMHGLADTTAPYAGGGNAIPGGSPPVEQSIATWVKLDSCPGAAQEETKQSIITHTIYAPCRAGTAVELYTIRGIGHEWPSVSVFPLSKAISDFFTAHPKQ